MMRINSTEATFPFFSRNDFQGQPSSRVYRPYKAFEIILDRVLGERVRADGACAVDLWCALANIRWSGPDGMDVSYGFRRAGEVVSWVREEETISPGIAAASQGTLPLGSTERSR
ncbi:hypothetical protein MOP88_00655 [Sphingomonas sp. WKB10]|jgi:hypothetical protein|nr:hypothetical protein [Sphingomonas sp. WKB10]